MRRQAAELELALSKSALDGVLLEARAEGVSWRELARALLNAQGDGATEFELRRATAALSRRLQRRATSCRVFQSSPSRQQTNRDAPCLGSTNPNKENDMKLLKRITTTEELFEVPEDETRPTESETVPVPKQETPIAPRAELGDLDTHVEPDDEDDDQLEADRDEQCCPPLNRTRR